MTITAFGLFFTARFSTARYLLIDIDDSAGKKDYPYHCEPLNARTKCQDVASHKIGGPVSRRDCQELCEAYTFEKWGCCEWQFESETCVFYEGSLEGHPGTGPRNRHAAQCGGADFRYVPYHACGGKRITSKDTAKEAFEQCDLFDTCNCIKDPQCDHDDFILYTGSADRDDVSCSWIKYIECSSTMDCTPGKVCIQGKCSGFIAS